MSEDFKYYLNWRSVIIKEDTTIEEAIKILNKTALKILLISKKNSFIGTVTDGDIRRALIKGLKINSSIKKFINKKSITANSKTSDNQIQNIMTRERIEAIPVLDNKKKIIGLKTWQSYFAIKPIDNPIIFMVGGKGKRLMPLTKQIPKPMLKVKGKPILQRLLEKTRNEGFKNYFFITGYLSAIIKNHFKNGNKWKVDISWVKEQKPLGTAGGLGLVKPKNNLPVIVANGDIITEVKYSDILNYHTNEKNMVTIVVKKHKITNPYGVVKIIKNKVVDLLEKPSSSSYISAGIYVFNPALFKKIKKNKYLDMDYFLNKLIEEKIKISVYPLHENWLDIGFHSEYKSANK